MPRISNIYSVPPGTDGFPDTTIESEKYNNYIHDVEKDLNDPRPISAGGTGANTADGAVANLGAEKSSQQVTDYNQHVFYPGSFYSDLGATGAPPAPAGQTAAHKFVGIAVSSDPPRNPPDNKNVVIRAYNQSSTTVPGRIYVREKKVDATHLQGLWGPWSIDGTGVAGPTPPADPSDGLLWFDSDGGHLYVWYRDVDSAQWVIASPFSDPKQFLLKAGDTMQGILKHPSAPVVNEDTANKGYVDYRISTIPAPDLSGKVSKTGDTMSGQLTAPVFMCAEASNKGAYHFGTSGTKYLYYNGADYTLNGGDFYAGGKVLSGSDLIAINGVLRFSGVGSNQYLYWNGSSFSLNGGQIDINGNVQGNIIYSRNGVLQSSSVPDIIVAANGASVIFRPWGYQSGTSQAYLATNGDFLLGGSGRGFVPSGGDGGFCCKTGDGNAVQGNYFNLYYYSADSSVRVYVDHTHMGAITFSCDYRTKKDVKPLPSTWDAVKALKPIKYTQKEFTPAWEAGNAEARNGKPFIENNDEQRWGFIAHELQETLVPTAASGAKDAANVIQSPNLLAVCAALTKALQEAMARIEALEAKV